MIKPHHVVIIGGGFAGLSAARELGDAPVQVTLIDRRNFHLFQPLLYQVATGGLSPANIAAPLRRVLKREQNVEVYLGNVEDIDVAGKRVILEDDTIEYDTLIVAAGSQNSYFGHDAWEEYAPGLKTVEDATHIRSRLLLAFEAAEQEPDPEERRALLTFVIVGAGPTGLELSGALVEIARHTLRHEFRAINPAEAQIHLVEMNRQVLPVYPEKLAGKAEGYLRKLGVNVHTGTTVRDITDGYVTMQRADGEAETIHARTIVWAAGVKASPLGAILARAASVPLDRSGRVVVEPDLTVPGHPEIFVLGDLANAKDREGKPLPGVAPVATQQGNYAAKIIADRMAGRETEPFRYRDYGMMATIGRKLAVAKIGRWTFSGFPAWMLWLLIHLMKLVRFENRLLVFVQWVYNYSSWSRSARLITEDTAELAAPEVERRKRA